ncbi:hypothetical protein [Roseateles amylovorans]|uniref:Uncharacterized protein n=1 Tax=Roseateles amylovorans TaxID=2978473 RepID=A0ABY6B176_9BURK|nr:hypothetical protein [Roseateles amylovorans]UXH79157.1 hypothetical protein N4261_04250 [Roseateles amylovorans]
MSLRSMERLSRHAAIGVRFWDVARSTSQVDGLQVEVYARSNPRRRKPMAPNLSHVYVGHSVPGLHDFEYSDTDSPALWSSAEAALQDCRVEVRDPRGRFLPLAFDVALPVQGLVSFQAPWWSPPHPIAWPGTPGSPPQLMIERIPLFSSVSRGVPDAAAVVYAQMRDTTTRRPAAWALLGVSIDGQRCGLGLADAEGRVATLFPYPEPPRRALTSPPEARSDFSWPVTLEVFWSATASPPAPPPEMPDLAQLLAQLETPGTVDDLVASPSPSALRRLDYRVPLTARTLGAVSAEASWLSVSPG